MDPREHLSRIEELLNELQLARNLEVAENIIKGIIRSANNLSTTDKAAYRVLLLLCADLVELVHGEKTLSAQGQQKTVLSEGFFKSFSVLRTEFNKAIAGLQG